MGSKPVSRIQRIFPYTVFTSNDLSSVGTLVDCCDSPSTVAKRLDVEQFGFWSYSIGLLQLYDFSAPGIQIFGLNNNLGFVVEGDSNGHMAFDASVLSRAGVDLFNITDSISSVQKIADVAFGKESSNCASAAQ